MIRIDIDVDTGIGIDIDPDIDDLIKSMSLQRLSVRFGFFELGLFFCFIIIIIIIMIQCKDFFFLTQGFFFLSMDFNGARYFGLRPILIFFFWFWLMKFNYSMFIHTQC